MQSITEELISYKIRKGKWNLYLKGENNKGQASSYLEVLTVLRFEIVTWFLEPAKIRSTNILFLCSVFIFISVSS